MITVPGLEKGELRIDADKVIVQFPTLEESMPVNRQELLGIVERAIEETMVGAAFYVSPQVGDMVRFSNLYNPGLFLYVNRRELIDKLRGA